MPLLATFTFTVRNASLASGTNCFAHSLPTTPDWALAMNAFTSAATACSLPVHLVTRTPTAILVESFNGPGGLPSSVRGALVAQFVHSIGR